MVEIYALYRQTDRYLMIYRYVGSCKGISEFQADKIPAEIDRKIDIQIYIYIDRQMYRREIKLQIYILFVFGVIWFSCLT